MVLVLFSGCSPSLLSIGFLDQLQVKVSPLPSGAIISVVKPEAWVFHKGLTFTKRTAKVKKYKDLYGIWFVLTQLNEVSFAVQKALPKLMKKNPEPWTKTFKENLKTWIDSATPQDWDLLERQDVGGKLTKAGFIKYVGGFLLL